ncbi:MAG: 30S ribosome-binding factor RbfA [Gemmatimonadales bacterium]|nr:MAG: 30S ribosome-binding factor RbfA [Gemmatimonadales bacterium]
MSRRIDRLSAQLKRELATLIRLRVKDPRVGLVTVTHVRVTNDLTQAKVFVQVQGSPAEREAAMEGLDAAAPFLRGQLGATLKIRRAPELTFEEDESLDHALRIEQLLDEVRPAGGWEDGDEDDAEEDSTDEGSTPR